MKKTTQLLLCALLTLSLVACNQPVNNPPSPAPDNPGTSTQAPDATPEATLEPTEEPGNTLPPQWQQIDASSSDDIPFDQLPQPINLFASAEEYPKVDGSTATKPLSKAMAYYFTGIQEPVDLEYMANHQTTSISYYNLKEGTSDIILAYEPDEETAAAVTNIRKKAIGRDALVFLVNSQVDVDSITTQQIQDIYTGKITNWKELGGKDLPITPFQRDYSSGSQALMDKLVMKDLKMMTPHSDTLRPDRMDLLIEAVSDVHNNPGAIGYSVYYYAQNMYNNENIRMISVDGVMPSAQSIGSGEYPYLNEFYCAIQDSEPQDSKVYQMFETMTGDVGKQLVTTMGYVPVSE